MGMCTMPSNIISDPRPILSLEGTGDNPPIWKVGGQSHVSKIVAYVDCDDLWFAIHVGGEIIARVHGSVIAFVSYKG